MTKFNSSNVYRHPEELSSFQTGLITFKLSMQHMSPIVAQAPMFTFLAHLMPTILIKQLLHKTL